LADNDKTPPSGGDDPSDIRPISIVDEMKSSYMDYAMSVIVSRALPDVRDGLKPVHRRILYTMDKMGLEHNKTYRKCAKVVGEVMGTLHPHGDGAIYDALVRMAQDFSMRLPLIDGQGNFGSIDNDPPAAMRYTECRLEKVSKSLLEDIDKDTVDFRDNYDGTEQEPVVLPSRFPNLLVNGAGGIAVGMATNIPPHNLGEVIDACTAMLDNPAMSNAELNEIVHGPDFPTGGIILGRKGIKAAYELGRGSVIMRGRVSTETIRKDREALIITEVPYQVNKAGMIEKMAELVRDKRIEGISDIRDESDKEGIRVVIELKRDAVADVVLNQLYRYSPLQTSFGCNMVALNGGKPEQLQLKDFISAFNVFREEVISRRTKYLLMKARERAHLLVGLAIAVANIDEVIKLIRRAPDPATARQQLMERAWPAQDVAPLIELIADPRHMVAEDGTYRLSLEQAQGILDLRLQRLTALGRDEIGDELQTIADKIKDYLEILGSRARIISMIRDELLAVKEEFGTPRRTEIVDYAGDVDDEDLIAREDMVVTVSHKGYIKRVPLSTYRAQARGGKGRSGMSMRDEDFVTQIYMANTHTPILFFSSRGIAYVLKVWRLPLSAPQAIGKALINLLPLQQEERITTIMPLPPEAEDEANWDKLHVMFATRSGNVRRNALSDFTNIRASGKIAMKLDEGDEIVGVQICTSDDDVLLTTGGGRAIRFPIGDVRLFKGRDSTGVRGIRLDEGDNVISMTILRHMDVASPEARSYLKTAVAMRRAASDEEADDVAMPDAELDDDGTEEAELSQDRYAELGAAEQFVLTLSENGYGKRSSSYEYRVTGRGGKGIIAMTVNERNGKLVGSFPVEEDDQIMLVTNAGKLIRCPVHNIRIAGRSTQGVTVFKTADEEHVVSVEHLTDVVEDEDVAETDTNNDTDNSGETPEGDDES
jgi:DNA gyrase subunit A